MPRTKLPDRRFSETFRMPITLDGGKELHLLVTAGRNNAGEIKEVFCADFKAGTALQSIIMDACVMISRLLQRGDTPEELFKAMCEPPSLLGSMLRALTELK